MTGHGPIVEGHWARQQAKYLYLEQVDGLLTMISCG